MKPILTVTLNPCIDGASEAERIVPTSKIRTTNERYYPGGGGLNVARVITELGGPAQAVYLRGGATGGLLDGLLAEERFAKHPIAIAGATRISHAVFERATGLEYRFVAEGPQVTPAEWAACLAAIDALDFDWLVASGSLPRGLGPEAFPEIGRRAVARGARFVLDTSGPALAAVVGAVPVALMKPSLSELSMLAGSPLTAATAAGFAQELIARHDIALIAVTFGADGALLVGPEGTVRLRPPPVETRSATGAGDSFLGAMTLALARGAPPASALRRAVAAGAAAALTPGTELCRRADVERLEALPEIAPTP